MLSEGSHILGDTGEAGWDDRIFNVKVYCKIETSPWHLLLPNQFAKRTSEWPEKKISGQSAKRNSQVTLVFSYMTYVSSSIAIVE